MQDDNSQDPLLSNKIAAAGLAALLLIFGLPQISAAVFGGHHGGGDDELHLAYCCVEMETEAAPGHDDTPPFDLGAALASASVAGGERRSGLCKSCHTFDEGGATGTGPNLYDIINRPVGSVSGFNYTSALKDIGGVWSYDRLDAYLKNSQAYVPGTAMVQRFPKDDQRADLLAYLGSLSAAPAPYPAPTLVEEVIETVGDAVVNGGIDSGGIIEDGIDDAAGKIGNVLGDVKDRVIETVEDVAGAEIVEDVAPIIEEQ